MLTDTFAYGVSSANVQVLFVRDSDSKAWDTGTSAYVALPNSAGLPACCVPAGPPNGEPGTASTTGIYAATAATTDSSSHSTYWFDASSPSWPNWIAIGSIGGEAGIGLPSVITIQCNDVNGNPVPGVLVFTSSDQAGRTPFGTSAISDSGGLATLLVSNGVQYVQMLVAGYSVPASQQITVSGPATFTFSILTPFVAPTVGAYASRSDVESIFGIPNVASWALLSTNDPNSPAGLAEVAARIALEIQVQTAEIDDHLRDGGYTLPLVVNESTMSVVRLCATLVGVALYENRGTIDYNHETGRVEHRYQFKKDWANKRLDEIRSGKIRWDAERPVGSATGPMVQQTPRRRYGQQQDGLGNYGISGGNNY